MRKYLPRRHYSEADRALMWGRWRKGESLHTIGRLFEQLWSPDQIAGWLKRTFPNVYFCETRSPWQRGSNENTNRLLRQYFPKGLDLSAHSQAKLNAVARQLNRRPRKTLNYETPAERFKQCVASIG